MAITVESNALCTSAVNRYVGHYPCCAGNFFERALGKTRLSVVHYGVTCAMGVLAIIERGKAQRALLRNTCRGT